jgi:16S rRNA (cytidine1402-2'-O)-methyltransferase
VVDGAMNGLDQARTDEPSTGRLRLIPNTLDQGAATLGLDEVLPSGVIRACASLRHWVVEDARSARVFLRRVDMLCPLGIELRAIEIRELPRPAKGRGPAPGMPLYESLLAPALAGHDVGLLSEAGLPAVADPGSALVSAAHRLGLEVEPLAGASSLMLALAASGLEGQRFAFVGYLPQDAGQRLHEVRELEAWSRRRRQTQIIIETPYRNPALFAALLEALSPATRLSVSCGLTLPGGWTRCKRVDEWRRGSPTHLPDRVPAVFCFLGQ